MCASTLQFEIVNLPKRRDVNDKTNFILFSYCNHEWNNSVYVSVNFPFKSSRTQASHRLVSVEYRGDWIESSSVYYGNCFYRIFQFSILRSRIFFPFFHRANFIYWSWKYWRMSGCLYAWFSYLIFGNSFQEKNKLLVSIKWALLLKRTKT